LNPNDFPWSVPGLPGLPGSLILIVAVGDGFDCEKGEKEQNYYQDKNLIG
jgi:hypothetical protein